MKFNVKWQEEKTQQVDFPDIEAVEAFSVAKMKRLGGFPVAKLLSIHPVLPDTPKDDKPPTPFGAPPSGTLGGGHAVCLLSPPDVVAA
jgi:hypothetical protein